MIEVLAWLWLPLLLYGLALGSGLLAERVAGVRLPNPLVAPVGLAVLVLLITPGYRLGAGFEVGVAVTLAAALAGAFLARRSIRSRLWPGWMSVAAALGAYALYLAPVALSGHWTWAGYEFVNDTSANLVFADYVSENGVTLPEELDSTTAVVAATPLELNYPLSAHFLLATLRPLSGAPLEAIYAPFMAAIGAFAAISLASIARRVGMPVAAAALAGVLAAAPNLLYRYVLHGAMKEILVVALLATATAVGGELLARRLGPRSLVLLVVALAPLLGVFTAIGALYGMLLGAPLMAVVLWRAKPKPRHVAAGAAAFVLVAAIVAGPTIVDTVKFGALAKRDFASEGGASTAFLGQLVRPLPLEQAAGVWFGRDYRYPQVGDAVLPNNVLTALVILLFVAGVISEARRRRLNTLALLFAVGLPVAVLSPILSPYADAKLLVVLSPVVVLTAGIGAYALGRGGRVRFGLALLATLGVCVGIGGSAAVAYREVRLAPTERMKAMEDAAEHARGGGLWLVNEWEEFGRYFMRDIRVNMAFEAESPDPARLREPRPIFGRFYDLDDHELAYVTKFPGVIKRRSPVASRPPGNFRMVHENGYYEVWRRISEVSVREHLPLQSKFHATTTPSCAKLRRMAARAQPGERLVAAQRPAVAVFDTARNRIPGWVLNLYPQPVRTLTPVVAGTERGWINTGGGRFRVWLHGSFGRSVSVSLNGDLTGSTGQVNTPEQWLPVGTADLPEGRQRIEIRRPETSLAPGDGYRGYIGPVALESVGPSRLVSVAPSRARSLCGRQWDWIERVERGD
ncbi:MAG: hypothetical protein WKF29_04315 [Thermoleophilaceae bacterium]